MNSQERTDISKYLVNTHYSYPNDMTYIGYEDAVNKYYNGTYSQDQFNTAVAKSETQNTDWFKLLTNDSFSADLTLPTSLVDQINLDIMHHWDILTIMMS